MSSGEVSDDDKNGHPPAVQSSETEPELNAAFQQRLSIIDENVLPNNDNTYVDNNDDNDRGDSSGGGGQNDNNDGKRDDNDDHGDNDAIPRHHMQLYQLYGDDADYFLHPNLTGSSRPRHTLQHINVKPLKLLKSHCGVSPAKGIGKNTSLLFCL